MVKVIFGQFVKSFVCLLFLLNARVHPAPALSLVLHLQASGGHDVIGQEVTRLVSRGWVKVDIFDQHNCVISGRWKVPLRLLPAKPSMTTGEMNGMPQVTHS